MTDIETRDNAGAIEYVVHCREAVWVEEWSEKKRSRVVSASGFWEGGI
jgi:hypothetical protein